MAIRRYRAFVAEGIGEQGPWDQLWQLYLGSESFVAQHQPGQRHQELSRHQTHAVRPSLATIFAKKGTQVQQAHLAYCVHGYQMGEIAQYLGLHYSTVSRRIRQAEKQKT